MRHKAINLFYWVQKVVTGVHLVVGIAIVDKCKVRSRVVGTKTTNPLNCVRKVITGLRIGVDLAASNACVVKSRVVRSKTTIFLHVV